MDAELRRALQAELTPSFAVQDVDEFAADPVVAKYRNMITWSLIQIVRRAKVLKEERQFLEEATQSLLEGSGALPGME